MVRCGVVCCTVLWCGVMWRGVVCCTVLWCGVMWRGVLCRTFRLSVTSGVVIGVRAWSVREARGVTCACVPGGVGGR